jgi:hypothetical protein
MKKSHDNPSQKEQWISSNPMHQLKKEKHHLQAKREGVYLESINNLVCYPENPAM